VDDEQPVGIEVRAEQLLAQPPDLKTLRPNFNLKVSQHRLDHGVRL